VDETFSIANGTVSATGTIIDNNNALLWQRSLLLRLPKDLIFDFTQNPSAVDTSYTFVLTNGTAVDYTTTDVIVTVPAGATTGTVSVPTTADTIDEVDETFSIANGTVSATGTISTITMLLWQRSPLRLPKDLMWYSTLP
jgi:hypothetical protein